jgi:hypothetical protein
LATPRSENETSHALVGTSTLQKKHPMRFNQKRYLTPRFILFFLFISFFNKIFAETTSPISEGNFIQRTILSLYFDDKEDAIQYHPIHNLFDMPLHHLGLRVKHWNLAKGIPEHIDMTQIRGLLLYFDANELPDPISFLDWIHPHLKNGKKLVLLGDIGFYQTKKALRRPFRPSIIFLNI